MDLDMGGRHVHYSGVARTQPRDSVINVLDREGPLTYPTKCWWCGQEVFFHTNGFGDAVLFDSLGWPWEVHSCWHVHSGNPAPAIEATGRTMVEWGIAVDDYFKFDRPIAQRRGATDVLISGFVADNHLNGDVYTAYRRPAARGVTTVNLAIVEIDSDDGRRYECLAPVAILDGVLDFALVRVEGRWCRGKRWRIYVEAIWIRPYGKRAAKKQGVNLGETPACYYCGTPLNLDERRWGFDTEANLECIDCSPARSRLGSSEYIELCKRVTRNRDK